MNEITFGSTFRIPVKQQGINKAKKIRLKTLLNNYENSLVGTGTTGYARVSMPNEYDSDFVCNLKTIGYKIFQKFEGENIPKENLDKYIKNCLDSREYNQIGKQKVGKHKIDKRIAKEEKIEKSLNENNVRNSDSYKDVVKRYGVEFAEAVFFKK